MSLRENIKISSIDINHGEISLACTRSYQKNGSFDKARCLDILKNSFQYHNPNIYLKDNKGVECAWTPLMMCCFSGFEEGARYLLTRGANPNMAGKDGKTCLTICSIKDKLSISGLLIKKGADINSKDKQGRTALMNACEKGDFEQIQFLVAHNADIKIKNNNNQDCIDISMEKKKFNIVSYLEHFYLNTTLSRHDRAERPKKI